MKRETIFAQINKERDYQDKKWGTIEEHPQDIASYILILERELAEAKEGWMKNKAGRDSALHEILQVASVAVACLEQHLTFNTSKGFEYDNLPS